MTIRIKNWKLAILALVFFCLFVSLGCWQLSRATQKKALIQSYTERTEHTPFAAADLDPNKDWRFYQARLRGTFDNQHTFLLDNKIMHGKVGYEVYTPFIIKDSNLTVLVDRGFVQMDADRHKLPGINHIIGEVTITGMLNTPPTYVALGNIQESNATQWPLRVEYINLGEIGKILGKKLFAYALLLPPKDPAGYEIEWQVVIMPPERHLGYAVQWFALAGTLLILFLALNRKRD